MKGAEIVKAKKKGLQPKARAFGIWGGAGALRLPTYGFERGKNKDSMQRVDI